jgi:DNA repair protein RadC
MYRLPIYKVQLVRDSSQVSSFKSITRPADAYEILNMYLQGADRENLVVVMLDIKNKIIGINTVGIGVLGSCPVHPREVFKPAILSNAAGIIIAHNHPSGDPNPSQDDMQMTQRIDEAGKLLGIKLVDHVIVGDGRFYSFREAGNIL